MRAVNLLPSDAYASKRFYSDWIGEGDLGEAKKVFLGTGAAAVVVAVLLGVIYFHEHGVVHNRRVTLAQVQQRDAAAQAEVAKAQAAQAQVQSQLATVSGLASGRVVWEKILFDLSRVLPSNVWLQSLQVQAPVAAAPVVPAPTDTTTGSTDATSSAATAVTSTPAPAPATPTAFTIQGFTGSHRDVALVLDRLALLPWLSDVTLQSSSRSSGAKGSSPVTFSVQANLNPTGDQ